MMKFHQQRPEQSEVGIKSRGIHLFANSFGSGYFTGYFKWSSFLKLCSENEHDRSSSLSYAQIL